MNISRAFKLIIALIWMASAGGSAYCSNRIPPGAMTSDTIEMPVCQESSAGGISASVMGATDRGSLILSWALGPALAGEAKSTDPSCSASLGRIADVPCNIEMGYEVFEFYSDRIPVKVLELSVNGGAPQTNSRSISLEVQFSDDLSGLKKATFQEEGSPEPAQDLLTNQLFNMTLGQLSDPPEDRDYNFLFAFEDRAGNKTGSFMERRIRLDMTPPQVSTVIINGGSQYVNGTIVHVAVGCRDVSQYSTGIGEVWITTDPSNDKSGRRVTTNQDMTTVWSFNLGPELDVDKTVYAKCRDGAGNWAASFESASIHTGLFNPGGEVRFDTATVVIGADGTAQTDEADVPLIITWISTQTGSLASIHVTSYWGETQIQTLRLQPHSNPLKTSIAIAETGVESDGKRTIRTIFVDTEGNQSAPVISTITLNRSLPNAPRVDYLVGVTSITFTARVENPEFEISTITFMRINLTDGSTSTVSVALDLSSQTIQNLETGLSPNTGYTFEIRAHGLFNVSPKANVPTVIYTHAAPPLFKSTPEAKEIDVIKLAWDRNGNPGGTEYQLEFSSDVVPRQFASDSLDWSDSSERYVHGLELSTLYHFRARARNREGIMTEFTDLGSTATLSYVRPESVINFWAQEVSSTTVTWRWLRNPSTEIGFQIWYSTSNDPVQRIIADIPLTSYATDYVHTYTESSLTPNTDIHRTIVAYNYFNSTLTFSPGSTGGAFTYPAPPDPLPLTVKANNITAHWLNNGNQPDTEYNVRLLTKPDFTNLFEESGWVQATTYEFRGLPPAMMFYIDVQARGRAQNNGQRFHSPYIVLGSTRTQTYGHQNEIDISDLMAFWRLVIPPHAISEDYTVRMVGNCQSFVSANIESVRRATEKARRETSGYRFPISGGIVEITLTDTEGTPINPTLKTRATLSHSTSDMAPDGVISLGPLRPAAVFEDRKPSPEVNDPDDQTKQINLKTLRIWKLDPDSESWVKLPENSFNKMGNEVQTAVPSFGVFAVMGSPDTEVNDVVVYPVPWRPHGPRAGVFPGSTGTEDYGIRFTNLPQTGKISIFDLRGSLVKSIDLTGNLYERWDARNSHGEDVGSGTYFWIAESGGNHKKGKLVVIR